MEADSLRLQIAAHPNPELRAKLEEAGVQVNIATTVCGRDVLSFRVTSARECVHLVNCDFPAPLVPTPTSPKGRIQLFLTVTWISSSVYRVSVCGSAD